MKHELLLLIFIFSLKFSSQAHDKGAKLSAKEIKLLIYNIGTALKHS
jgi:hypothetical protein